MTSPGSHYPRVAICSGHMIDAPERKNPRFPPEKAEAVRQKIAAQLARWEIGAGDLAICGGACGSDILFAEECQRRGARIRLLLAEAAGDFVRDSVRPAGEDWVQRFQALQAQAEVEVLPRAVGSPPNDESIYGQTNLRMIETARREAGDPKRIYALLVWDERPTGDGLGGTSDFKQKICRLGAHLEIINPTTVP